MTVRRWWLLLLVWAVPLAQAATVNAFLDRSQVSMGDTVTLNIQSSDALGTPDLSPLRRDFQVLGTSRSSSVQIENGKATSTYRLGVALAPLHAGTLAIPALDVGGAKTPPLTLHVGPAPSGGHGKVGDPVFMEAGVRSSSPYVGQETVYTVRLFYLPGVDGALGDPAAKGARMIQLDRDHRYVADRDGYTYKVIERSWALIPGRSGAITIDGPEFQGQRLGAGFPNGWFSNPNGFLKAPLQGFGAPVRATAPSVRLDARAAPANAGKPWLPARDVTVTLTGLPADGKADAGEPVSVTLAIRARGLPASALPEPELPPIAGARVYPDQVHDSTDDSGEWLEGTRSRSFAIVPEHDGTLTIPAITLDWWDVTHDRAEQAKIPAHTLHVTGVVAAGAPTPAASTTNPNALRGQAPAPAAAASSALAGGPAPPWRTAALASLALWLLAVIAAGAWWALRRRGRVQESGESPPVGGQDPGTEPAMAARVAKDRNAAAAPAPLDERALQRQALAAAHAADAAECARALLAWARWSHPSLTGLDGLRGRLADAAQREALESLQRVRWQGGDVKSACAAVADAFASGFAWRDTGSHRDRPATSALPPLYPPS